MIGAEFLGMIMLIVYVGQLLFFLFVVMMLNVVKQKNTWFKSSTNSAHIPIGF